MKLVICVAALAALAACTTPGKTPSGADRLAKTDDGKQCTVASSLGSNMKRQECTTQAQREAAAAAGKGSVDAAQAAMRQSIPQD
jgi:hypothetical protein